jgi:hypothetical protein
MPLRDTLYMASEALSAITGDQALTVLLARMEWNNDASVEQLRNASRLLDRMADEKVRNEG